MRLYKNVLAELEGKSRREQYKLLLETKEWFDYRDNIISLRSNCCEDCKQKAGDIEVDRPIEEYEQELKAVRAHNDAFLKEAKNNPNLVHEQLMAGTYEGQRGDPVRTITIGRVVLQVHHKIYFFNKLPWEYQGRDVKVLCSECHALEHQRSEILLYKDESKHQYKKLPVCSKCTGSGYLPQYHHVDYGRCWECDGNGVLWNSDDYWHDVAVD